ncbi:hypothetical protein FRB96_006067 [Tulasnella sp. 330]|nr:hypothetical protein FRB96_006067 [Tulasnella sp. 330]
MDIMTDRKLSEEAKALSALRKQKRAEKAAGISAATSSPPIDSSKGNILKRDWVLLRSPEDLKPKIKIMTWNMLAQTLVRRDLFPNSDCLKAGQREDMLTREILTYDPDIACLQEVDRLEKHLPVFSKAGYAHVYASGPAKRHGCLILYKEEMFEKGVEKTVFYDDTDLTQFLDGPSHILEDLKDPAIFSQPPMSPRIGSSIKTKNIASIVALARKDGHPGCVIATTHTFWHPNLQDSRVIHVSRDASVATTHPAVGAREDEDEGAAAAASESTGDGLENHPDRIITNARPARPEDGLLTDAELLQLYQGGGRKTALRSGYDEALAAVPQESDNVYGAREPSAIYGRNEPMYTSFTHYWRLTLDYIFIADPTEIGDHPRSDVVVGVLKPHRKKDLGDGLPMRGVCGSDHVALMIEVSSAE